MNYNDIRTELKNRFSQSKTWLKPRRNLILICVSTLLALLWWILVLINPKPPILTITFSRLALSRARQAGAEYYEPAMFKEAEYYWNRSLELWRIENKKAFFNRDFQNIYKLALKTNELSKQVEKKATQTRDSLKNIAEVEIKLLQQKISEFKANFNKMPMKSSSRKNFNKGELLILEAKAALTRGDYKKSMLKIKNAEPLIGQAGKDVSEMLTVYLKNIPTWRKWVQETINWSKENQNIALIVDKISHTCLVYNQGQLHKKYPIELGSNWIGHKRQRGDNATPEGHYLIRKKVPQGQSKYYKALEIDYPNEADVQNFNEAMNRGDLPLYAQIGGLIEIHGDGGKGIDWTQGCIALKNKDLDQLFDLVNVGTPVTIVGSINGPGNNGMRTNNVY